MIVAADASRHGFEVLHCSVRFGVDFNHVDRRAAASFAGLPPDTTADVPDELLMFMRGKNVFDSLKQFLVGHRIPFSFR